MTKEETLIQIAKMIASGKIPSYIYDMYLSDTPIGFMNEEDLIKYLLGDEKPILTDKEKAYLESFLKPFKDKIQCISKYHNSYTNEEYLMFCVVGDDDFNLPNFKKGTMYKGIELYKEYTLKELGLFEGIEK